MTSQQIEKDATDAMRFLRTCGSDRGARQADAIQRLLSRFRAYENALCHFKARLDQTKHRVPADVIEELERLCGQMTNG